MVLELQSNRSLAIDSSHLDDKKNKGKSRLTFSQKSYLLIDQKRESDDPINWDIPIFLNILKPTDEFDILHCILLLIVMFSLPSIVKNRRCSLYLSSLFSTYVLLMMIIKSKHEDLNEQNSLSKSPWDQSMHVYVCRITMWSLF